MSNHASIFNRRLVLGLAAAGLATPGAAISASSNGAPSDALNWFIKMRGSLDGRLSIGFLSGRYDGFVDGERTPLFGLFSATFTRYRMHGERCEAIGFEQAYFTDLRSHEVLKIFKNPYTGEVVEVPVTSSSPSRLSITSDLRFHSSGSLPAGVQFDMFSSPPEIIGDEVFFVEQIYASKGPEGAAPRFAYTENTTLRANLSEVKNANAPSAPCQTSFDALVSWRPWLKMGARPGCMAASGHGRYGVPIEALPSPWLKATGEHRPELLSDPDAVLEPLWSKAG